MNWEAMAAIGDLLGAGGVIASLLYLGQQIKQNTRQVRVATHDGTTRDFRHFTRQVLTAGLTDVFSRGLEDYETLDDRQRLDFAFMMFDLFKAFENVHYHYVHGTLGEDAWQGWRRFVVSYATAPGALHYWRARRDIFTPEFRVFIDDLKPDSALKRVGHVFSEKAAVPAGVS
jgi:hypothetical protein